MFYYTSEDVKSLLYSIKMFLHRLVITKSELISRSNLTIFGNARLYNMLINYRLLLTRMHIALKLFVIGILSLA